VPSFPPEGAYLAIVPSLMGTFVCGGLTVAALWWGRKRSVDYLFAAICFIGAIINADLSLVNLLSDETLALKIDRLTYLFFVFGPAIYIHFVHAFLGIKGRRLLEITAYLLGAIFLAFTFTDQFISGFNYYRFGRIAKGGFIYHLFTAYCALTVLYILFQLYLSQQGRSNVERNRIKYIIAGLGLASILLALNIIPTYGYDIYPVGSLSFIPATILAVGVLKYDLLDLGAVARKGLTYTILIAVLTLCYVAIASLINATIVSSWKESVLAPLVSALVMVVVFDPVKRWVQDFVDRIFFRGRINYEEALEAVSAKLTTLAEEKDLCPFIEDWILRTLNVERVDIFVKEGHAFQRTKKEGGVLSLPGSHPLTDMLMETKHPLHAYQVDRLKLKETARNTIKEFFASAPWALIVPVISHHALIAFFALGEKKSGEVFWREELGLLSTVAHQTAMALENAWAFAEIKAWNEKLEKKVEERTKELTEALRDKELAQRQMIRSEALAAIGELVAGTAHELNNPLSSAMSLLQSSLDEMRENCREGKINEILDDLDFARRELKRAADIVRSLLDVSRETQSYLEEVDINQVIEDALRVLHNVIKKMEVQISKDFSSHLPKVRGNFAQLGQVFINIIKNALQALPDGKGEIFLSTALAPSGQGIIAQCADTGIGIPEEIKLHVFKPFFTTKEVGQGTGLGLYICHEVVRRHHGEINIFDRPGGGTIVRVDLPLGR